MFDSIPEDKDEAYPCDCGGSIKKNPSSGEWECDSCDDEGWRPANI
jgi:ribosomal protein L37AE/L43A